MTLFRAATLADAEALLDAEHAANIDALTHVFPPELYPYPTAEVRARWEKILRDPSVRVLVAESAGGISCFVAYDREVLRHLGVRPPHQRRGLARAAVETALAEMINPRLWCLASPEGRARLPRKAVPGFPGRPCPASPEGRARLNCVVCGAIRQ